jgi:hypothetical protein
MIALYRAAGGGSFYGFGTNTDSTMEFHAGSATNGHPLMKLKAGVGLSINGGSGAPTIEQLHVTGQVKITQRLILQTLEWETTGAGSGQWQMIALGGARNLHFYLSGTLASYINTSGSYIVVSDRSLKKDEQPIQPADALSRIRRLVPKTYRMRATNELGTGFIAQEVAEVIPDAFTPACKSCHPDVKDHPCSLDINAIFVHHVAATQAVANQVDELRLENQELRERLSKMESIVRNMSIAFGS